jgi:hypothetical protein
MRIGAMKDLKTKAEESISLAYTTLGYAKIKKKLRRGKKKEETV